MTDNQMIPTKSASDKLLAKIFNFFLTSLFVLTTLISSACLQTDREMQQNVNEIATDNVTGGGTVTTDESATPDSEMKPSTEVDASPVTELPPAMEQTTSVQSSPFFDFSDYPVPFINEVSSNLMVVVGAGANQNIVMGATDVLLSLGSDKSATIDEDVHGLSSYNVITIGTPCENKISRELLQDPSDCLLGLQQGEALIKLVKNGKKIGLVIAGYSTEETRRAARVLANYKIYNQNLHGTELKVRSTNLNDITVIALNNEGIDLIIDDKPSTSQEPQKAEYLSLPVPLKSYFEDDFLAKAIMTDELTYQMDDFKLLCRPGSTSTSNEPGFKIINALKQTGYFFYNVCDPPRNIHNSDNMGIILLNEFQRNNGMPESSVVDKAVLLKLTTLLDDIRKNRDELGRQFVCYDRIASAPPNDASKEHRSYLLMNAVNAFPESLRLKKEHCSNPQIDFVIKCDYLSTGSKYWMAQDENCNKADAVINVLPASDYNLYKTMVHEYAHFLDCNNSGLHPDFCIDTTSFYSISYDTTDFIDRSGWRFYKPRIDVSDLNEHKQHFFSYAAGWYAKDDKRYHTAYEDFAVNVEMYVTNGIVYRDYMRDKPVLRQKYEWIKENVFSAKEFDTGDPNYAAYASDLSANGIPGGVVTAGGITELQATNYWDYDFN